MIKHQQTMFYVNRENDKRMQLALLLPVKDTN